jgi:hypothetical protein
MWLNFSRYVGNLANAFTVLLIFNVKSVNPLYGIKPKFLWKPDAFTENFVQVGSTEKLGG